MKQIFALLFVVIFIFQSSSDLWILTTFYMQQDYISENICINRFDAIPICKGQCVLTEQLKSNEQDKQNSPNLKENKVQLFHQGIVDLIVEKPINQSVESKIYLVHKPYTFKYSPRIFHPPQVV